MFLRSSMHHLTKAVAFLCGCFTYALRYAVVDETPSALLLEQACTSVGISSVVFLISFVSIVLSPVFLFALPFFSPPSIVHRFDFQATLWITYGHKCYMLLMQLVFFQFSCHSRARMQLYFQASVSKPRFETKLPKITTGFNCR